MKYLLTILFLAISLKANCQFEDEALEITPAQQLGYFNELLENLDDDEAKLETITSLLYSDSTDDLLKLMLLNKYMRSENLKHEGFKNWLIENMDQELMVLVNSTKPRKPSERYPILYFLAQQEKEVFSVDDLMNSSFMANCELFDDAYHKMYTCKLLAEVIASQQGLKFNKYTDDNVNECAYKNYQSISGLCIR